MLFIPMEKSCVVYLTFIVSTCLAGIVIETSKPHESTNLVEATVEILTSCYKNRVQTVGLAGNTPGVLLEALWAQASLPVTLIDNTSKKVINGPVRGKSRYKLQVFIVTASSGTQLKQTISQIKDSPWWNHMASFFIVDWSTMPEHGCSNSFELLWTAWEINLLNAKFMCLHRTKGRLVYNYNPYTSQAPDSWHLEATFKGKNNHPWTLIVREYRDGNKICEDLDFEKTNDLGGYEIRCTARSTFPSWRTDTNKSGIHSFQGWNGLLAQHIFRAFNATPNLKSYEDLEPSNYGFEFASGNVKDVAIDLTDDISDILLNPREPVFFTNTTITYPMLYHGICIVTQHRGYKSTLNKIASVLDGYSQFGLLVASLITLIFFKCFLRQSLMSAIMNLLRIVCNSCLLKLPTNLPARIYLTSLFFLYITILAIYQGKLASLLTKPIPVRNVDTLQDLVDLGYTIYGTKAGFGLFDDSVDREWFDASDAVECLAAPEGGPTSACIWRRDEIDFMYSLGGFTVSISQVDIATTYRIYAIRENWPLEHRLNRILSILFEAHIIEETFMIERGLFMQAHKPNEKLANQEKFNIITLDELLFAFVILGFGLGCASACFIVEIAIEWARLNVRKYIRSRLV